MENIVLFDLGIRSLNKGDEIIMEEYDEASPGFRCGFDQL